MVIETYSEKETKALGQKIGENAKPNDVICIIGDLGVGKTIISKGIAEGLGIRENITSPTFTIVNEYETGRLGLYHFDTYRISDEDEMYEIGFDEYINKGGICVIEWADTIRNLIPEHATWIQIEKDLSMGEDYRKIDIDRTIEIL